MIDARSPAPPEALEPTVEELAERWWIPAVRGLAAIAFGVFCLAAPTSSLFALVMLFGAYALVDGVANLVLGFGTRRRPSGRRWRWLVFEGVASVLASVVAFAWPRITALALVLLVAAWALVTGGAAVAAAIRLRRQIRGEWLLGLSGAISIMLGVLLALYPGPGLVAMVFWIGAYAILGGALLVALALRLRGVRKRSERGLPRGGAMPV